MTDITIPPEAVRAGKIAWVDNGGPTSDDDMAAAIRAALKAWPGAAERRSWDGSIGRLILPLTEKPDDQA